MGQGRRGSVLWFEILSSTPRARVSWFEFESLISMSVCLSLIMIVLMSTLIVAKHSDSGSSSQSDGAGSSDKKGSSGTVNGVKVGTSTTPSSCINRASGITVKPAPDGSPLQVLTFFCPGVMRQDTLKNKVTTESQFEAAAWGSDHGNCCVRCYSDSSNDQMDHNRQLFILQASAVQYKYDLTSWEDNPDGPMQRTFVEWIKGDGKSANTSPSVDDLKVYCPSVFDKVEMTTKGSLYSACVSGFTYAAQCAAYNGTPLPDVQKLADLACGSRYVPDSGSGTSARLIRRSTRT